MLLIYGQSPSGALPRLAAYQIQRGNTMKKLYVGNLSYGATEDTLRSLFESHGTVESVTLITDRDTGRSKGFGFVEMSNDAEAQRAITALSGREVDGRALTVNEARPKTDRGGGGGGRSRW
jgi:cold-inducible RNA-binding protein